MQTYVACSSTRRQIHIQDQGIKNRKFTTASPEDRTRIVIVLKIWPIDRDADKIQLEQGLSDHRTIWRTKKDKKRREKRVKGERRKERKDEEEYI